MTKPREDERAEAHLENQGYELFRPLIRKYRLQKGRQVPVIEPLFPRYIFIRLDDVLSNWATIRSTRGVAGMVRFTDMPAIVPDSLIEGLACQCLSDNIIDTTEARPYVFGEGDRVEITQGSFRGIEAIIKEQVGEDRVLLLMNLLGTEHALELPISQVKSTS